MSKYSQMDRAHACGCIPLLGHGMCECGECVCDKAPSGRPYTGEICDCYPDDDACQRTPEEVGRKLPVCTVYA